ncbi:hypothetical protein EK0264_10405 [Epidermidibacterium keratini]|uniref:Uncharacterized protein n=1 Tax=Epidermidibacterium keratini TaxID=1891644 RepID=A0A7L4YNK7_9ACTN|nr:hypothetical protein [Epidermidibacterium keratini]QHC00658.1 hypothetical protein EK0264_10405 [Epidermidibacterium keratini]
MDTSILQTVTTDFAAYLSEVTAGDLNQDLGNGTIGELYLRAIEQHRALTAVLGTDPSDAGDPAQLLAPDEHGGGYDRHYRRTAAELIAALDRLEASAHVGERTVGEVYAAVLVEVVARTGVLAAALGLPYQPDLRPRAVGSPPIPSAEWW